MGRWRGVGSGRVGEKRRKERRGEVRGGMKKWKVRGGEEGGKRERKWILREGVKREDVERRE